MLAMRNFMVTNRQKHYNIMMPQGLVQFTDAKWLHNVRSFTIWGGPTQLQNVGTSSSTTENIPIWFNEIFLDNAGTPPGSGTEVNGYTINTNPKFSNSVTLVSSANVSNFAVNTWVLVYGYNQASSGYPPSMRTFEYRRIQSISGGTLTFYEPLMNEYRSDWADLATDNNQLFGAARVLPLNRPLFNVVEYAELNDLEFLPSTGYVAGTQSSLGGSLYSGGCIKFIGRRLKINGYYYPTQGMTTELEDCWINFTEIDKVIDRVTFRNCEIMTLDNGPAANFVRVVGGRILSPIANLNCREFVSENTKFYNNTTTLNQIISLAASCFQRSVQILRPTVDMKDVREETGTLPSQSTATSTTFILPSTSSTTNSYYNNMQISILSGTGVGQIRNITAYTGSTQTGTVAAWAIQPDNTSVYKIDRVLPFISASATASVTVIAATSPNQITCSFTGVGDPTVRALGEGSLLKSTTTSTNIKVTRIRYNGTNTVIEGTWIGGTPGVGEVFTANLVLELLIDEPNIVTSQSFYRNSSLGSPIDLVASGNNPVAIDDFSVRTLYRNRNRITVPFVFFRNLTGSTAMRLNVNGVVVGIRAYVSTAYTGAQSTATVIITRPSTEGTTPFTQTINLKTAGGRRCDVDGTSTALSGDTLQAVVPQFCKQLNFTTNNDLSDAPPVGYIVIDLG
jgi:hypothetical protein